MNRLEAAKKLCEDATLGPWTVDRRQEAAFVVAALNTPQEWNVALAERGRSRDNAESDAEFIAQARALLPDALEVVEAALGLWKVVGLPFPQERRLAQDRLWQALAPWLEEVE